MNVFISHPFKNEDLASILQSTLKESNIEAYMAQRVKEYELVISQKIRNEIENSDYVVAIVTSDTRASASVNQELGYAQGKGVPIIIMLEKEAKIGVLTYGIETEEFERITFNESCNNIKKYLITRNKGRKSNTDENWLKEYAYIPLYNAMMKIKNNPDKFTTIPPNPFDELQPFTKLKVEEDVRELFSIYSKELSGWKELVTNTQHGYTLNLHRLGEIVKTAFDLMSLTKADGHIQLDERSSQEPRHWIDAFKFIIFDDSISNDEVLYQKLLDYSIKSNNGHQRWLQNWKATKPDLFHHIFSVLPQLRSELRLDKINKEISEQKTHLEVIADNIVTMLEEKLG